MRVMGLVRSEEPQFTVTCRLSFHHDRQACNQKNSSVFVTISTEMIEIQKKSLVCCRAPRPQNVTAFLILEEMLFFQGLSTFAGTFLTAFVVAKVLWLILEVIGEDLSFKSVLAVVAHVTMLMVIIRQSMLALSATVMPNLENLDLRNPLATNLAFFLHPHSPVIFRLLSSLDLITLANIWLLALGLSRMSGRLSMRAACVLVAVPWTVYVGASLLLPAFF
jgi:hypothetical protein